MRYMREQNNALERPWRPRKGLVWLFLIQWSFIDLWIAEAGCIPQSGCNTAYAYYKVQANETLDSVGEKFQVTSDEILAVNPSIVDKQSIVTHQPLYIPFNCGCIQDQLLHMFKHQVQRTNTIGFISKKIYEDLTKETWIGYWNGIPNLNFIETGTSMKIPVQCFCGDPRVSLGYGLFLTYVVAACTAGNVSGLASNFNTSEALLRVYNPLVVWNNSQPEQYAFIPVADETGSYPQFDFGSSKRGDADDITIAGVLLGIAYGVAGALALLSVLAILHHCFTLRQRRRQQREYLASKLKDEDDRPFKHNGGNYLYQQWPPCLPEMNEDCQTTTSIVA
ncbi:chitin elicitor receptor kinase 1-like isoform X1 [Physcomitrium patens]|uniref:chitin elicitor receptor kinase 1-like isoform X1 n=1 Tax=Physcomitrium patens TaxID=3218 RepID=UPI000D17891D|nr:chitin elicitor receptor kinase 1-like isoform X1 [Physcomitrium patens]|eukprot:XP_024375990.1 chitin elicitor receptor kinase 1-like isoform X1 [Physcomitrella patens]